MNSSNNFNSELQIQRVEVAKPPLRLRLYAVWYRHVRVYARNIISNGLPPFLEPLVFLEGLLWLPWVWLLDIRF